MNKVLLGNSDLLVSKLCLGSMTFGEQVSKDEANSILDFSYDRGLNFIDTAEMYPVPASKDTYGYSEIIIGNWFKNNPSKRSSIICATKIAGPSRGLPWIHQGDILTAKDFEYACNASLKRLRIEVIDLYQIHWPFRFVPSFGQIYYDHNKETNCHISIHEQLVALHKLVNAGKVRAIGLSNETPYGVHEFVRLADHYDLPRIASVQNPFCLLNRSVENALDESLFRLNVSLLAYSPLAFGLLTGKYDLTGFLSSCAPKNARLTKYDSFRKQRWGRDSALEAARLYNSLAYDNGLTPVQLALAFCVNKWQVASTIIGVSSLMQLKENIYAASIKLDQSIMDSLDGIRLKYRDPAQ
jgi:aryl-alcohol dehydrogenase-like predicted oxidoreductase